MAKATTAATPAMQKRACITLSLRVNSMAYSLPATLGVVPLPRKIAKNLD